MANLTFMAGGRQRRLFRRKEGGPWYVRFQHNGLEYEFSLRTTLDYVAKDKAKSIIESAINGEPRFANWQLARKLPVAARQYADRFQRLAGMTGPAVYVLLKEGKAIYVGQSASFIRRFASHLHISLCDEILHLPTPLTELDERERELIRAFRPSLNQGNRGYSRKIRLPKKRSAAVEPVELPAVELEDVVLPKVGD
jgi:hypothetical protein